MLCKYCCHSPQRDVLCESAISTLVSIKSKNRKQLLNIEADLRCALTNTIKPRIKPLVASKQKQKSHYIAKFR